MPPCCKECNSDIAGKVNYFLRMSAQLATIAEELTLPAKIGRPSVFTDELGAEICDAVANGLPLYRLCHERSHWPERATIYRWADERPEFRDMFTRARELKAHLFTEEMQHLADTAAPESVRVAELQIKTRQWLAGKLARDAYGDAPAVVNNNAQINVVGFAQSMRSKLDDMLDRKVIDVTPRDPCAT